MPVLKIAFFFEISVSLCMYVYVCCVCVSCNDVANGSTLVPDRVVETRWG